MEGVDQATRPNPSLAPTHIGVRSRQRSNVGGAKMSKIAPKFCSYAVEYNAFTGALSVQCWAQLSHLPSSDTPAALFGVLLCPSDSLFAAAFQI